METGNWIFMKKNPVQFHCLNAKIKHKSIMSNNNDHERFSYKREGNFYTYNTQFYPILLEGKDEEGTKKVVNDVVGFDKLKEWYVSKQRDTMIVLYLKNGVNNTNYTYLPHITIISNTWNDDKYGNYGNFHVTIDRLEKVKKNEYIIEIVCTTYYKLKFDIVTEKFILLKNTDAYKQRPECSEIHKDVDVMKIANKYAKKFCTLMNELNMVEEGEIEINNCVTDQPPLKKLRTDAKGGSAKKQCNEKKDLANPKTSQSLNNTNAKKCAKRKTKIIYEQDGKITKTKKEDSLNKLLQTKVATKIIDKQDGKITKTKKEESLNKLLQTKVATKIIDKQGGHTTSSKKQDSIIQKIVAKPKQLIKKQMPKRKVHKQLNKSL